MNSIYDDLLKLANTSREDDQESLEGFSTLKDKRLCDEKRGLKKEEVIKPYVEPFKAPEPYVEPYKPSYVEPYVAPEPYVEPYVAPEPYVEPYVAPEPYFEPYKSHPTLSLM